MDLGKIGETISTNQGLVTVDNQDLIHFCAAFAVNPQ